MRWLRLLGGGRWRWFVVEWLGLGLDFGGHEVSGGSGGGGDGRVREEVEVLEGNEGVHQISKGEEREMLGMKRGERMGSNSGTGSLEISVEDGFCR